MAGGLQREHNDIRPAMKSRMGYIIVRFSKLASTNPVWLHKSDISFRSELSS